MKIKTVKIKNIEKNNLDINEVYGKYVDLYIHLDNSRFTFLAGILIISTGIIGISRLFQNTPFFYAILGLTLIVFAFIIKLYRSTIAKFTRGQDYVSLLLAEIEEKNKHIFDKEILSPREGKKFVSWYSRKKYFILEDNIKYREHSILEDRQSRKHQNILKNVIMILYFIGVIMIILNFSYLIWKDWEIIEQIIKAYKV